MSKLIHLIQAIKKKSENDDLNWELSGDERFVFVVLKSNVFEIHHTNEPFSNDDGYLVRITDGEFVFDHASNDELGRLDPSRSSGDYYTILQEIFNAGWRKAVGADDIIDTMLDELKD